jgi:tetratricopeptide (TPR) repeat protein
MRKTTLVAIALILIVGSVTPVLVAEKGSGPGPEVIRDRAISKLVAWRPKSAQNILQKEARYEESQPWLTAEAFLMATYGIGKDEKTVNEGLEILKKQAKKDPHDPVSQFYLGEVLAWLDESDAAKAAWKAAKDRAAAQIAKKSRDARAQFYLGASRVRLKQTVEARKALKKAVKYGFDKPMVDFQIGLSYLLEQNWKAAKSSFDDVHELDPRYAHLYFYRGLAWDKLGRKDNLINDLDQFVKLAPNSPEAKKAKAILSSVK